MESFKFEIGHMDHFRNLGSKLYLLIILVHTTSEINTSRENNRFSRNIWRVKIAMCSIEYNDYVLVPLAGASSAPARVRIRQSLNLSVLHHWPHLPRPWTERKRSKLLYYNRSRSRYQLSYVARHGAIAVSGSTPRITASIARVS